MVFAFVLAIIFIVFVLGPMARAHADRVGRGADPAAFPGTAPEVVRLREEVDRLSAEVAKLTEEQQFMLRLLAPGDRPPTPASAEGESGDPGPHPAA
ncbi:MAG TPA: hypothetical protein VHG28_21195 [Longimicrobiaceae bacterium]|nr:hypothetical protein [Longimicrobiaceae bacterium]